MWQLKQLERLHEIEPDTVDTAIAELLNKEPKFWNLLFSLKLEFGI